MPLDDPTDEDAPDNDAVMAVDTARRGQQLICEGWFASHADSGRPGPTSICVRRFLGSDQAIPPKGCRRCERADGAQSGVSTKVTIACNRSSPPVAGGAHVVTPHVPPRGDREDHDDHGAADQDLGRGRVEVARDGFG